MTEEQILYALSLVDNQYIEESSPSQKSKKHSPVKRWATLAACLCLVVVSIFTGYQYYYTESSYISIDVNPSIELCLNPLNRVIDATAYNEDGQLVLDTLDLENMKYSDAIHSLLNNDRFNSYLQNDADLTFTIVSDHEETLSKGITQCMQNLPVTHSIHCTDTDTLQAAHSNQCSVGKYTAYQQLARYDETITIEDCKDMTMHEIHERIKSCADGHHSYKSTNSNNSTTTTPDYSTHSSGSSHSGHH